MGAFDPDLTPSRHPLRRRARFVRDRLSSAPTGGQVLLNCAWPFGNTVAPGRQVRHALIGGPELHKAASEFNRAESGDVGNRKALARNVGMARQFLVQPVRNAS